MKNIKNILFISMFMLLFFYNQISYAASSYAPFGGSYNMDLIANNAVVASMPTIGSNGVKYYSIAPPNQAGIVIDSTTSRPSGTTKCLGNYLKGDYLYAGLHPSYAYHRVFAYMPTAGFSINGLPAYQINSNTFFTLYSQNGITQGWQNISATGCSNLDMGPLDASIFNAQFPFEVRLYVKEIALDGKIIIPAAMIAGYTRIFQDFGTPTINVPAEKATIKLNLTNTIINYPTNCSSNIDNLNINHQTLDATNFNSKEIRTIIYQCEKAQSAKVKFALDYVTDNDPQKRLPLKSGNNTIYSELTLYDASSNQRGKTIETTIDKIKNIQVESHLSGLNAEPGKYNGSAWVIANYL